MDETFTDPDQQVRDSVSRGFIAPVAEAGSRPEVDAIIAAWPPALRSELERQRSARHSIADGVWIEFPDDTPGVAIVWVIEDALEALACDGEVVYLVGDFVQAIGVDDGEHRWTYNGHDGSPLHSSGGVTIATMPDGILEVIAPFEYRLRLDARDGAEIAWLDDAPTDETPNESGFPGFPLQDFDLTFDDSGDVRIATHDGGLVATISIARRSFDPLPAMQVRDVLILPLMTGHVLGLRQSSANET